VRSSLEAALLACADSPWRAKARRFLRGLSYDELLYIAEYLGCCILESAGAAPASAYDLPTESEDRALKMILVKEYLRRAGGASGLMRRAG
jgi:hypothetical protein